VAQGVWRAEDRSSETPEGSRDGERSPRKAIADLTLDKLILKEAASGNW
jgi:hypothetical protein